MILFDRDGKEIESSPEQFCSCGKSEKDAEKIKGFGGYWRLICPCGNELKNGREA